MIMGDLVRYWFVRKYPITGIVLKRWNAYENDRSRRSYLYSVEIMEHSGQVSVFDVHTGDDWEVLSGSR